jgi:hypothetical protein
MSRTDDPGTPQRTHPTGERRAELERIRDAVWPPNESLEARKARIARNVAALEEVLRTVPKLDAETVKWLAEDPDVSDMQ